MADHSPEAQAWFSWQLCKLAAERGFPRSAAVHGRSAVALFRQMDQLHFQHFALAHLSIALALSGDTREAKAALTALDALELGRSRFWTCDVFQARAWVAAIDGDLPSAHSVLREASALAAFTGDYVAEASTLHMMARLGAAHDVSDRLAYLADQVEGRLIDLRAGHARALATSDALALERLSAEFEDTDALLLAAEAAADAATVWRRGGAARRANSAQRRSDQLARYCEDPSTPKLVAVRGSCQLTRAESQVAKLAAAGVSNQRIADQLCVSRRTVENQLQHVYSKLGLAGRGELAGALAATTRPRLTGGR